MLDKDAESYPAGTIKAYGFKAGDGNYYAVEAEAALRFYRWGGFGKLIESLPLIGNKTEVLKDYNGEHNTIEIIKALDSYNDGYVTGAPAAEACRARTFNGKSGFLPAAGQFADFQTYKSEVDSLAAKFSLDVIRTDVYWSSTQQSAETSWALNWGGDIGNGSYRNSNCFVRAFFAL